MLIPRFTLRTGLMVLTAASVLSIVVREAVLGKVWAIGLSIGLGSVVLLLFVHGLFFALAMIVSRKQPDASSSSAKQAEGKG